MACKNNIPMEVKARRIIQCADDDPINVLVTNQHEEFDHSILCEANEDGEQTGVKILVVIAYSEAGVPTSTYYNITDGSPYTLPEGYALTSCSEAIGATVKMQPMCDTAAGNVSFIRWFILAGGEPTGVYHDTDYTGASYTSSGFETLGACTETEYQAPGFVSVTGDTPVDHTAFPSQVRSFTVTAISESVDVSFDGVISMTVPEGGSFSWGEGNDVIINVSEDWSFTGASATAQFIITWD